MGFTYEFCEHGDELPGSIIAGNFLSDEYSLSGGVPDLLSKY